MKKFLSILLLLLTVSSVDAWRGRRYRRGYYGGPRVGFGIGLGLGSPYYGYGGYGYGYPYYGGYGPGFGIYF